MNEIVCQECQNLFGSKEECFPLILPCGHSYCSSCVENKIKKSRQCPRNCLYFNLNIDFPKNDSLLNISRSFQNSRDVTYSLTQTYATVVEKTLIEMSSILDKALQNYELVEAFRQEQYFDNIMQTAKNSFNSIKLNFQILDDKMFPKKKLNFINIIKYSMNDDALNELKSKFEKEEKIYASGVVNGLTKYGQVVLKGNDIFVNSLNLVELERNSSYFRLRDFKILLRDKICPFFTLPRIGGTSIGITLIFDIVDNQTNSGFLELCTGETGITFKNSMYICTDENTVELNLAMNDSNYINCGNKYTMLREEEIVIRFVSSKKWEIKNVKKSDSSRLSPPHNVIGKLKNKILLSNINPTNNEDANIIESGIVVSLDRDEIE